MAAENVVDRVHGADGETIPFQPIPFHSIGLTRDAFRRELGPGAFRLLGPAEGAATDASGAVQFWWQPSAGADGYRLVVATDRALSEVVADVSVEANHATLDRLKPGQTYYWQVYAETTRSRSNRGRRTAENGPWELILTGEAAEDGGE